MFQGFKDFIARGNVIDLAVGVVMGAAFSQVTTALVGDVLNPLIGGIFGKPDFTNIWTIAIGDAKVLPGAVVTALANFLLVAIAVYFCIVFPLNRLAARRAAKDTADDDAPAPDVRLLTEIRDLLAERPAR
jgi:large conductance mechanosensitive channel